MRQNATFLLRPPATPREAHEADGTRPMRPVPVASGRSACHNLRQGSVQTERATLQKLRQAAPAGLRRSANFRKRTAHKTTIALPLRNYAGAQLLPYFCSTALVATRLLLRAYPYRRTPGRRCSVCWRGGQARPEPLFLLLLTGLSIRFYGQSTRRCDLRIC